MKRLYSVIFIIFALLGIALFNDMHSTTQAKKIPTVGILQFMTHPALNAINKGIMDELKANGYVNGKNIKIDFQNAQGDQSNLKTMATKFDNENATVSVGIATPAAQALVNTMPTKKVLFAASTNPVGAQLVKSLTHPGKYVTGVSDQAPLKVQLKLIKKMVPTLKTLGIIYTSSDDSATTEAKKMQKLATDNGIKVKVYTIAQTNDLAQIAQTMVNNHNVDAVFVPTDNTIASAMPVLVQATNQAKVPVFPTVDTMVKQGGVAAESINQYAIGRKTGKMLIRILKGQKISDTPVEFMKNGQLVINTKQTKKLGINVANNLLTQANKQGGIIK
ncbi:tryptophan ABC transporter substrate-binding protein [Periweissella beninensis]|uniref:tryptophan ABC transporter substrate-binding protein n=1 Tax=Periweissella beninensis TaxID=504936 RepID=UPI0021A70912|nr:tryptophan ABC transporter substrate-binding protein [Periweissella beninensis]MCT4395991.1 ABC transporter substrate-binding protein [Periweissella beninensis]